MPLVKFDAKSEIITKFEKIFTQISRCFGLTLLDLAEKNKKK
jgi:hypothetical protein